MSLRGKKILITAGPTWVALDSVRVISNISSGANGILISGQFLDQGAKVTLLLGPGLDCDLSIVCIKELRKKRSLRVVRFRFFRQLAAILKQELKNKKYDIIIHSAAVSDFCPVRTISSGDKQLSNRVKPGLRGKGKLDSQRVHRLELKPLPKLISLIRKAQPAAELVMFKLESGIGDKMLIQRARSAQKKYKANWVVANRINPYRAFIIDNIGKKTAVNSKLQLAKKLLTVLS